MSGMESETIKELAKLGTATVEFANRVFGGPLEQLGGLAEDQLAYWRAMRQAKLARLFQAAEQRYAAAASPGALPQPVPPKLLEPILREATLEEDPEISEMWASLLAAAADPASVATVQASFPAILAQLSPQAARVVDMLYLRALRHGERKVIRPQRIRGRCGLDIAMYERVIDHLLALGLVRVPSDIFVVARLGGDGSNTDDNTVRLALVLTATGFDFVQACRRGRPAPPASATEEPDDDAESS